MLVGASLVQPTADGNRPFLAAFALAFCEQIRNIYDMAASSKLMIGEAERRFPVRLRLALPPGGLGSRRDAMTRWLDATCGADGWAMTPSGLRGVVNDAVAVYFRDATLAGAFAARWCRIGPAEIVEGAFLVRTDAPTPRIDAPVH
jgi:hypothetical protein